MLKNNEYLIWITVILLAISSTSFLLTSYWDGGYVSEAIFITAVLCSSVFVLLIDVYYYHYPYNKFNLLRIAHEDIVLKNSRYNSDNTALEVKIDSKTRLYNYYEEKISDRESELDRIKSAIDNLYNEFDKLCFKNYQERKAIRNRNKRRNSTIAPSTTSPISEVDKVKKLSEKLTSNPKK